jgi:hypothetical protein
VELDGDHGGQTVDGLRELGKGGEETEVVRTFVPQNPVEEGHGQDGLFALLSWEVTPGSGKSKERGRPEVGGFEGLRIQGGEAGPSPLAPLCCLCRRVAIPSVPG